MTERRSGQDGQNNGSLDGISCVMDHQTGKVYVAVDADAWLRRRISLEEDDNAVGAYVSPFATLGADRPGRRKSTKPRIPPGDLP